MKISPHRSWALPTSKWMYYQEWNRVLFFHYKVTKEELLPFIPAGLELDSFEGEYWISIVPFTMENIRPRFLPAFKPISNFHEINVRTYVTKDGKPGVFFLSIDSEKYISTLIAKLLSGLPYKKDCIHREDGTYRSTKLDVTYEVGEEIYKSPRDIWLTERYCLYLHTNKILYRYEIHHDEWNVKQLILKSFRNDYKHGQPDLKHYSDGVKVFAWKREQC